MANSITSLRTIARLDWPAFVESQSALDDELRNDPSGHYALMTFGTRGHYRHVVERISPRTKRLELEALTGYAARVRERLHRLVLRHPNTVFFGSVGLGTLAALAALLRLGSPH